MSHTFILQNQQKFFLSKELTWTDGRNATEVFKTPHKDEAVNQMFEANSKDHSQRIIILTCETTQRGVPILDPEWLPEITSEIDDGNDAPQEKPEAQPADTQSEPEVTAAPELFDQPTS